MRKLKIISFLIITTFFVQYIGAFAEKGELTDNLEEDVYKFDLNEEYNSGAKNDDVSGYTLSEAEDMAVSLGFMDIESDGNFRSDELLTYSEYVNAIFALSGSNIVLNIKDETVTLSEAVSGLITILGYSDYAKFSGKDNISMAIDLKLITTDKDKKITRGEFAELLKSAYGINVYKKIIKSDGSISWTEGNTLLEENDILKVKGFVNAVPGIDVFSVNAPKENIIEINRVEYHTEIENPTEYLGAYVQAYVKHDQDADVWKLLYIKESGSDNSIKGLLKSIESLDKNSLVYSKDDSSTRRVTLNNVENVVINGDNHLTLQDVKNIDFENSDGYFMLSKSDDGVYDTFIVWLYDSYRINSVDKSDRRIHLMYGAKYKENTYIEWPEDGVVGLTLNGGKVSLDKLKQGMTVSVAQNKSKTYTDLKASDKTISGKITSLDENGVEIDDTYYTVSDSYIKSAEKEAYKTGESGVFYLNIFGSIAGYQKETSGEIFYAYLRKVAYLEDTGDDEILLKVFTDSGKWEEYYLVDKPKIDGKTIRGDEKKAEFSDKAASFENSMIRLRLNDDNEVVMLDSVNDTAYEQNDKQRLTLAAERVYSPLYFGGGAFLENTQYKFKNTAPIFYLPSDRSKTDDFRVLSVSSFDTSNQEQKFTFDLYTPDEFYYCDLAVCHDYVQTNESYFYVTKVYNSINEEDEPEYIVEGYLIRFQSSKQTTFKIKNSDWESIGAKGIKISENKLIEIRERDGYITNAVSSYDCSQGDFNVKTDVAYGVICGKIEKIDIQEQRILVNVNGEKDSYKWLIFNPKKAGKNASNQYIFEDITLADLNPGDRVLMQHGWGFYYTVIVLEK